MATCPHCRNEVSAMATRCPFCTGTFPSHIFTQMKGLGQLIILLLVAAVGYVVWLILKWIYELVITILTFIWNVVTWPFRFTWQSFENVIIGSTNLVGINHDPAWWETIILMGIIAASIGFLWLLKPTDKNWIEEKTKIKLQNIKVGVTTIVIAILISCGIWVSPALKISSSAVEVSVSADKTQGDEKNENLDPNPEDDAEIKNKEYLDNKKRIDWIANKVGGYKGAAVCKVTLDMLETVMINKGMSGNKDGYESARKQYELVDVKFLMEGVSKSDIDAAYSSALKSFADGKNPTTVDCYGIVERAKKEENITVAQGPSIQVKAKSETNSEPIGSRAQKACTPAFPEYPRSAVRENIEGTALVEIYARGNGAIDKAKISKSSGSKVLDDAALVAARKTICKPFGNENEGTELNIPYAFKLE